MEAARSTETSILFNKTTRRHIPEDSCLHVHYRKNFICQLYLRLLRNWSRCFDGIGDRLTASDDGEMMSSGGRGVPETNIVEFTCRLCTWKWNTAIWRASSQVVFRNRFLLNKFRRFTLTPTCMVPCSNLDLSVNVLQPLPVICRQTDALLCGDPPTMSHTKCLKN